MEESVVCSYGRVYLVTNTVNGKVYVGQTTDSVNRRWSGHKTEAKSNLSSAIPLYRAIRKYGVASFEIRELEVCFDMDHLNLAEIKWICTYRSVDSQFGYNATSGGDRHHTYTQESRARISQSLKQRWREDPTYRTRVSEAVLKQWQDTSYRKRMSAQKVKYFAASPEVRQHLSDVGRRYMAEHPQARTTLSEYNKTFEGRAAKSESRKAYFRAKGGRGEWASEQEVTDFIRGLTIEAYLVKRMARTNLPTPTMFQKIYGKTFKELRDGVGGVNGRKPRMVQ